MATRQLIRQDLYSATAVIGCAAALYFIYKNSADALSNWYWLLGLVVLALALIGKVLCDTFKGVLVDDALDVVADNEYLVEEAREASKPKPP